MHITINGKERELKFTYNSIKYLNDFDFETLTTLDKHPFRIFGIVEELLVGAVNHNPKATVKPSVISEYLEKELEDGNLDLAEFLKQLIELLEDSSFFKALQKTK